MSFGEISVRRLQITIPTASAKRLEKNRKLIIQGCYVHWDDPQEEVHIIPDGINVFEFDFKDKSDPDEDVLDGRIHYNFFVEYSNSTGSRKERIKPKKV